MTPPAAPSDDAVRQVERSLRFIGDVSVPVGLLLAALAAAVAVWLYRRDLGSRSQRESLGALAWLLPVLRAAAVALVVLALLEPVLHHRRTIGELGRVRLVVDASASMARVDPQMPAGRKLRIADALGWTSRPLTEAALLPSDIEAASPDRTDERATDDLSATDDLIATDDLSATDDLNDLAARETDALARFDESPRWQRVEALLTSERSPAASAKDDEAASRNETTPRSETGPASLLNRLAQSHEVTIVALEGRETTLRPRPSDPTAVVSVYPGPPTALLTDLADPLTPDARRLRDRTTSAGEEGASGEDVSSGGDSAGGEAGSPGEVTGDGETASDTVATRASSAVVLFSDGQHNAEGSPLQTARLLGAQGTAIYPVVVGPRRPAADVAIASLVVPDQLAAGDRLRGRLQLRDTLPAGTPIPLAVTAAGRTLWSETIEASGEGLRTVEFSLDLGDPDDPDSPLAELRRAADSARQNTEAERGVVREILPIDLQATASGVEGESDLTNNAAAARLGLTLSDRRLLLLDGRPRWETRYLRNLFQRDPSWQLTTVIAGPIGGEPLRRGADGFPASRDDLFAYDVVLLGELPLDLLTEEERQWLVDFVAVRGGGLVLIDGDRGELAAAGDVLQPLLPVERQAAAVAPTRELVLTDRGASLAAMRLVDDRTANRQRWQAFPSPRRPIVSQPRPGSETWLEAATPSGPVPLLVARRFGGGQVLYLATDETWRWRYRTADLWHQRIWNQWVRSVMPQPFAAADDYVAIDAGPVRAAADEPLDLRVRLRTLEGQPATGQVVDAVLSRRDVADGSLAEGPVAAGIEDGDEPRGREFATVRLVEDDLIPGLYRGRTAALPAGDYTIVARASGYPDGALRATALVRVMAPPSQELGPTAADYDQLAALAEASGGVLLQEEEAGRLIDLLQPLSNGRVIESDTPLVHTWWWFLAVLALLTIEWLLRKRAGLL